MSKVSSKRSRKSKLTCRKYEIEENMADFQKSSTNNANTKPKAKAPLASTTQTYDDFEALIDSQKKPKEVDPHKLEFSVTVAVEEFDEDSSDLIIIETNEQSTVEVISSDSETNDTVKDEHTNRLVSVEDKEYVIDLPGKLEAELVLDRNEILNATNEILKNPENIADKILGIEVRNCIGQYRTSFEDKFEAKIQSVFLKWFDWQKSIEMKFRSSPLFYKCYICKKSWWYLHDFREHLKGHAKFILDLEEYTTHEANIIAYLNVNSIVDTEFEAEGGCPKCGYEFATHISSTRKNSTYICKVTSCYRIFYTCFALKTHEYMFHTTADFTGEILDAGKRVFCKVCSFVFYSQKSYQSHVNLMHTVRSDLVVPVRLNNCPLCNGQILLGTYHICSEKKKKLQCKLCYRSFQRGRELRAHMAAQNGLFKCRICDELLSRRCVEAEHLMKHTDKFVIVKKCLICKDFTVFLDHQTAFDHISVHLNMMYEGSNYKYISKILIPKSCLLQHLEPKIEVKEELSDIVSAPELKIEQDIIDGFETDAGDENKVQIKEEIDIHEDFESDFVKEEVLLKTEADLEISRIFGVKIDASDIDIKQEMQVDEESEYEDDIIKLDFLDTMQESVEYSTQDCILKVENTTQGTQKAQEDMRDDEEDKQVDEEYDQEEDDMEEGNLNRKRNKMPKIYSCRRCGFAAAHKEYKAHIKSHCYEKLYERKIYSCTKCSTNFEKFNKFIDHFTKHNLSPLSCPECFKSFKSYKTIELHIETHIRMTYVTVQKKSGWKKESNIYYKCRICEETVEKIDFFQHWVGHLTFKEKTEDHSEKPDVSDSYQINTEMLDELLQRLLSPEPICRRRGCPICLRHFDRKNYYKRHLVEHLLNHAYSQYYLHKELKCQICEKGFYKPDAYKKHMRDHGDLRDYKCEICDKFFSDSSNYSKHIKLHNKNAYTCDICKKKFQAKYSLEKHIVIHDMQKPILCTPCNKTFFLESAYKKHYKVVHSKEGQTYLCKICKVRFKRLKDKWDHFWHVHKERSMNADCPKCSKSYRKFRDLQMHMRTEHLTHLRNSKVRSN
ncbi:unnamed protein product [Arctia plantaginis]|uniref:C2H2-type domain-containing protein n=1 Tax=Arctia plantaginis TaxID=874455 RepID=A0A8S1A4M7_ARCPL|nr:unnamed protein product [Arctia plantaginis]